MSKNEEGSKDLDDVLDQIEKTHGKGSIMMLGSKKFVAIDVIPTSSLALDVALGVGGVPRGRVVEIYGPESGGKTTLALHIIAQAQKLGGQAAYIDAEHALDPVYARKLGVDVDHMLVSQPDNGEQALEIAKSLIESGKIAIIVVDSVAALVPKAELEGDMGDPQMGLQARLMSQALRKLTGMTNQTKTVLIFINQIREKIGVMFGNPETTTGGRALKFYASVRLDIRKTGLLKDGEKVIGAETRIKVVKNKVSPPFTEAAVRLMYGKGISHEWDLLTLGVAKGVIEKSGSWFSYQGQRLGQGAEQACSILLLDPVISGKIESALRDILFPKGGK
jgi:recombination protein RecA